MGSSWTRDQTHVPCIGRWILNHCATREVPLPWSFDSPPASLFFCPILLLGASHSRSLSFLFPFLSLFLSSGSSCISIPISLSASPVSGFLSLSLWVLQLPAHQAYVMPISLLPKGQDTKSSIVCLSPKHPMPWSE